MIPGSAAELAEFAKLQTRMATLYERVFDDPKEPRTVVVVPSLSLDQHELEKISGVLHYEERMLCLLMLLKLPRTRVVFVTSQPVHPTIIDYYLHLLPGVPTRHARERLTLLSCDDGSHRPLTQKILDRPRLLQRIRDAIVDPDSSHMTCFNATAAERTLAVRLAIPMYATDPALSHLGSKAGSRELFRSLGVTMPDGVEGIRDIDDVASALVELRGRNPELRRSVVKLNRGFSGEGNGLFVYRTDDDSAQSVKFALRDRLAFEANGETLDSYLDKLGEMGGVVEEYIEGSDKRSPSVQTRIDPLGRTELVSTHDQLLGGPSGQVFLGCSFPADPNYFAPIQDAAKAVTEELAARGALGRLSVDFVSVPTPDGWQHYAIEINLRKGGTTLPYLMLLYLTDGEYDPMTGLYATKTGQARFYVASDNVESESYLGLGPDDLVDIGVFHDLHFDASSQQGVVFHLLGALSEFGKLGMVAISDTPKGAQEMYESAVTILDRESALDQTTPRLSP